MASARTADAEPIPILDRLRPLPLSFAQERLWFLDGFLADRATYNVPLALRLTGPLDIAALGEALDGLAVRHEVLRTRIVVDDGRPWQHIDGRPPFP